VERIAAELHLELLLGRRVHDAESRVAGRIEEFKAEQQDGEWVVTEFHLGAAAWFERLSVAARRLPIVSMLPAASHPVRCARWDQMDLDDPLHPRLRVSRDALDLVRP